MTERVLWWVWKEADTPVLEPSLIKPIIKALLDNTKDKNTSVRAQSEHTIVNLLRLRQGDTVMQVYSINTDYSGDLIDSFAIHVLYLSVPWMQSSLKQKKKNV